MAYKPSEQGERLDGARDGQDHAAPTPRGSPRVLPRMCYEVKLSWRPIGLSQAGRINEAWRGQGGGAGRRGAGSERGGAQRPRRGQAGWARPSPPPHG